MRFRGITKISVDAKGRIAVPKHHRDLLERHGITEICLTADPCGCLLVYPMPEWERIEDELVDLPIEHPRARRLQRLYIGYATPLAFDSGGRVLLTPELREYARIVGPVMLVGQGRRLELWDERAWIAENEKWRAADEEAEAVPPPPDAALKTIS